MDKYKSFVSVCTPTSDRRKYIPCLIEMFKYQEYPQELMEWIVIDDGKDAVSDLFEGLKNVKYEHIGQKMILGEKRNYMNKKAVGDIIVYMDDDDYYPPTRVKHAVETLENNPTYLIAGSSRLYTYFIDSKLIYEFGPYGENHATANTFAFKRRLLDITNFENNAKCSEEKYFLHQYFLPMIQLEPENTILCISHSSNTFDKKLLLRKPSTFVKGTDISIQSYINNDYIFNMLSKI